MNKLLRILLVFTIIFTTCTVKVPDAFAAVSYSWDSSTKTVTITGSGNMDNYNTSDKIATWVTKYAATALKIVVSEGITSIGEYAFYNFNKATSLSLPSSLKTINSFAFRGCSALTSVTIPEKIETVLDNAFYGCTALKTINFNAKNCDVMGTSASSPVFNQCSSVTSLNIGSDVRYIPNYSFVALSGIKTVTIPDNVSYLGEFSFYGCSALETVVLSDKLREIRKQAFYNCAKLKNINTPRLLMKIGDRAFGKCSALTELTLGPTVTDIGHDAFFSIESTITLNVVEGSYAHEYAEVYEISAEVTEPEYGGGSTVITPTASTDSNITVLNGKLVLDVKFDKELTYECVHIAFYNSANKVVDYMIIPLTSTKKDIYVVTNDVASATYAKIFIWDSLESCMPVSKSERVSISRP